MPLIHKKSKKAFEHNLKAEVHAGKPKDQALAIAYSEQKSAPKAPGGETESHYDSIADAILRKKKMSAGGEVESELQSEAEDYELARDLDPIADYDTDVADEAPMSVSDSIRRRLKTILR